MEHTGNHITLCGTLRALPEYSHCNHERRFFRFELEVKRLSGTADVLPVMAAEDVLMAADLFAGGRFLVEGQIRSFNSRAESGRRLIISVFAESVTTTEQPPQKDAVLTGAIVGKPVDEHVGLRFELSRESELLNFHLLLLSSCPRSCERPSCSLLTVSKANYSDPPAQSQWIFLQCVSFFTRCKDFR